MKRVRISFAGLEAWFVDRERALSQIKELAERGTFPVYVIYGPEGCGKTAFLKQARVILEEDFGYSVVYASPLAEESEEILSYTPSVRDIVEDVIRAFPEPYSRVVDVAISAAGKILKRLSRPRLAVLMDDIFQAVGLDKAEAYTKTLLNLIEWPPASYERIVVLVTSSEGLTRERIGRHNWADLFIMWNMNREGFKQLYDILPDPKPPFEEVWRLTGGNPRYLEMLYKLGWSAETTINRIVRAKALDEWVSSLDPRARELLGEIIEDPDAIFRRIGEDPVRRLRDGLVERNLVIRIWDRDERSWIDAPPPERDPELGIGLKYAWQTPLHREAVRRALRGF